MIQRLVINDGRFVVEEEEGIHGKLFVHQRDASSEEVDEVTVRLSWRRGDNLGSGVFRFGRGTTYAPLEDG